MERKFGMQDMKDDVLVYFSRDLYFYLSSIAQNQGQESTPSFPLKSRADTPCV